MNRKLKHGMSMAVAILSALFINTACTDEWDTHYNDNGIGTNAGKTSILDKIREDNSLTDFCAVLDSMNIVDKYGNLVNFADSLFNQSRVYTLWAPVNGTFDKEQWLGMLASDTTGKKPNRDKVLDRFIGSHVADYLKNASGELSEDNFILLLNQKMVPFVGVRDSLGNYSYSFDGIAIDDINIRVSNGIIHKIGGCVNYLPNIWEYIEDVADASNVAQFLYSFNKSEFDPYLSIEGPTENGDKTYIDSVFTNSNQWLKLYGDKTEAGFGDISKEDSSYLVFVPSNKVWDEMIPQIEQLFKIHTPKTSKISDSDYALAKHANDSLCNYYARKMLLNHIVFSTNDQPTPGVGHVTAATVRDSLLSTYKGGTRRLFAKSDLMDGVIDSAVLSNGTFYLKDNFNFSPFYLWFDTIKVEAENSSYQGKTYGGASGGFAKSGKETGHVTKIVSKYDLHHTIDSANREENLVYVELEGLSKSSNQSLTWTIPEVLSGSYYVGVVVVPAHVASKDSAAYTLSKPNLLDLTLGANEGKEGSDGKPKTKFASASGLENDPTGIDTVWFFDTNANVRQKIKFNCCEYGLSKDMFTVTLEVKNAVKRQDSWDAIYDRKLRVDKVILEPVENDEE